MWSAVAANASAPGCRFSTWAWATRPSWIVSWTAISTNSFRAVIPSGDGWGASAIAGGASDGMASGLGTARGSFAFIDGGVGMD